MTSQPRNTAHRMLANTANHWQVLQHANKYHQNFTTKAFALLMQYLWGIFSVVVLSLVVCQKSKVKKNQTK